MRATIVLGLACGLLTVSRAGETPSAPAPGYAVIVSKETRADPDWKKVVDALVEKHSARVIVYDGKIAECLEPLKNQFPRYVCFVATPEEANRDFVVSVHRLTRKLDEDPYTDVVWGIVTGYSVADALRIARARTPLLIRKGAAGTGLNLGLFDEGCWYNEGVAGEFTEKKAGGAVEKKKGPSDTAEGLAKLLNDFQPEFFMTSGHATERDWQPGYSFKAGQFRCRDGKLFGLDLKRQELPINSPNPKIFLGAGNCLIGNIPDKQCMALAWLGSGGANQMAGYTVVTWHGAMGWGTKDYFLDLPGRYTFAEAFFFANQSIVHQLETRFAGKPCVDFDKWDMEKDRTLLDRYAKQLGYSGQDKNMRDHLGLLWDRDTVAFYGDPAWQARLAPRELPLTTELTIKDSVYTFNIRAKGEAKPGRPLALLLPHRIKNIELMQGKEFEPLIADNFIMLTKFAPPADGQSRAVIFKAERR